MAFFIRKFSSKMHCFRPIRVRYYYTPAAVTILMVLALLCLIFIFSTNIIPKAIFSRQKGVLQNFHSATCPLLDLNYEGKVFANGGIFLGVQIVVKSPSQRSILRKIPAVFGSRRRL